MFIKIKDSLFAFVMSGLIVATLFTFESIDNKRKFIQSSKPTLIVVDKKIQNAKDIEENLEKLTYQKVEIESFEGVTYVKIKCPPEKASLFKKIIRDLTE